MSGTPEEFQADIDSFIQRSERLMTAVVQKSAEETARIAQKPKARGGRMPVDTGFLRNSLTAHIGAIPSGRDVAPEGYQQTSWASNAVILTINNMELGDTIYLGWTAHYALHQENKNSFMRTAAQQWRQTVDMVVRDARERFG